MEDSAAAGATVRDVNAHEFIRAYAAHLKNKIEQPKWADLVKTATWKELAPYDPDWYYVRAASIARKIYLRRGTGIGALRKVYGGRARDGARPNHYRTATGSIIRHVLHQLEAIKVVEIDSKGGRQVTRDGRRDLDTIAVTCVSRQE